MSMLLTPPPPPVQRTETGPVVQGLTIHGCAMHHAAPRSGDRPPSAGVGGGDREGAERGACVWNQPSQRLPSDPKVTASGLREWRKQGQNSNGEKASLLIYRQGKDSQKPGGVLVTEPLKLPASGKVFFFF